MIIWLRKTLKSRRPRVFTLLALAALLSTVIWAHAGGESAEMSSSSMQSHQLTMAFCLAVLEAGAVVLVMAAVILVRSGRRAPRILLLPQAGNWTNLLQLIHKPYARAGPAGTQVFLR